MSSGKRILVTAAIIIAAAAMIAVVFTLSPDLPEKVVFEKPIWNLVFESEDIPAEKDFRATYRVVFENSAWKKDDPDKVRILGTVELDMDGEKKRVRLRQTNLANSYFEKNGDSYKNFAYVNYDWVLKGDSEIKNDGVYLSKWVPVRVIRFPFKIGDRWDSGDIPEIWGVAEKLRYSKKFLYAVTGEEEITVPAGTFKCLRVRMNPEYGEGAPDESENWEKVVAKKWYAKGVGVVKTVVDDPHIKRRTVAELVSYSRGPDVEDMLSPALTELAEKDIPLTPGQVALWQISDNMFAGTRLLDEATMELYGAVWEGEPRPYAVLKSASALHVSGPAIPLFETGKVYDFPLSIGKSWKTSGETVRTVVGPEITTARLITYLAMKLETKRGGRLVAEEWIAPGVGPVRRTVYRPDGLIRTFELELFLEKTGERAEYVLPWRKGESYVLTNPFGIGSSERGHKGTGRFSYDWGMPVGVPLVAARAGVVVACREDSVAGGVENKQLSAANILVIRHDDDTLSHYSHLDTDSIIPELGDRVEQGQFIAKSGNTGWTSGPHLHFSVTRGGYSVPFSFRDTYGRFGLLEFGKTSLRSAGAPGDP
ncbi:MAG: M23 family metallopeptidase [Planctomycetota bacterium]|jgi:murein DD-endopeptidase MepM/ murein hydrolase activator NlpD